MSITVGRKGFHLNFSKHGVRQTTGLPGSGISHTSYLFKNDEDKETDTAEPETSSKSSEKTEHEPKRRRTQRSAKEQGSSPWGFFFFMLVAVFFIYFGGQAFGLLPPNLLTDFLNTLTQWSRQIGL